MRRIDFSYAAGKRVLVALSGGADSVALLRLLLEDGRCEVVCAHYEHGLRGEASLRDAEFCRALCADWNVPLYLESGDVSGEARRTGEGVETAARRMRHAFLERVRRSISADLIALAHHMNDQAETVLMHLFRGSGMEGLTGMQAVSGHLYRPLLGVTKEALVAYLRSEGIPWREDATNVIPDTPRNRIRLSLLPEAAEMYPGAVEAIAREARLLTDENDFMRRQTKAFVAESGKILPNGSAIRLENRLEGVHIALFRRAVRMICPTELDAGQTEIVVRLASERRGKAQLSADVFAEAAQGGIYFVLNSWKPPTATSLNLAGETCLEGVCHLTATPWTGEPMRRAGQMQTLSLRALDGAKVRTRRPGDRIRPFGMTGEKTLSDYFTDRKIDRPLRDVLPVIAKGERVYWVPGVGISEEAALKAGEAGVRILCEFMGQEIFLKK